MSRASYQIVFIVFIVLPVAVVVAQGLCFINADDTDFEELLESTKQAVINVEYSSSMSTTSGTVYYYGDGANMTNCLEAYTENDKVVIRVNSMELMQKLGSQINATVFEDYLHLLDVMGSMRNTSIWDVYCKQYLESGTYAESYVQQLELLQNLTRKNSTLLDSVSSYTLSAGTPLNVLCYAMNFTSSIREYFNYTKPITKENMYHKHLVNNTFVLLSSYKPVSFDYVTNITDGEDTDGDGQSENMYGENSVGDYLLGEGTVSNLFKLVAGANDRPNKKNPKLRRMHLYDILKGYASTLFTTDIYTRFYNNVTQEVKDYISNSIESDEDGIGYVYNRVNQGFWNSLSDTARSMNIDADTGSIYRAYEYTRDISMNDVKLLMGHESIVLDYKRTSQVMINIKQQRKTSFQYEKLLIPHVHANNTRQMIPRHILQWSYLDSSDNLALQVDRWPFTEYFTVEFWLDERGWNGTDIYDRSVLRPWHPKDWWRWLFSWLDWLLQISRKAGRRVGSKCDPNPGFFQDMTQGCHVTTFAYMPAFWSEGFVPDFSMCKEWNSIPLVYKGTIQLFGTLAVSKFLENHPGYKPLLSWIVRYDDPSNPTRPYVGDNVLPCMMAKSGAWLLLVSSFTGSVLSIIVFFIIFDEPIADLSSAFEELDQSYYDSFRNSLTEIMNQILEEEIMDTGPLRYMDENATL